MLIPSAIDYFLKLLRTVDCADFYISGEIAVPRELELSFKNLLNVCFSRCGGEWF